MKIHEYQAKAILSKYGVAVPRGEMVTTREEAERVAKDLMGSGATGAVVKAQIHAGGRGKGGGVKIAKSPEEAGALAEKMLGMTLVTHQTGPHGLPINYWVPRGDRSLVAPLRRTPGELRWLEAARSNAPATGCSNGFGRSAGRGRRGSSSTLAEKKSSRPMLIGARDADGRRSGTGWLAACAWAVGVCRSTWTT